MTAPTTLLGWGKATSHWAAAAATRAFKTLVQTFVGAISGTALFTTVDWKVVASSAVVAAVASFAQSLDGLPEVAQGSAPLSAPPTPSPAAAAPDPAWPADATDPDPYAVENGERGLHRKG